MYDEFMVSIDRLSNVLAAGRLQRHGPSLRYLPRPLGQKSSFSPALTSVKDGFAALCKPRFQPRSYAVPDGGTSC
jgi:hypothetical protein